MRRLELSAIVGIACIEVLNYATHVVLRPTPWNGWSVCIGYVLWAMQLCCFSRLQIADPGTQPLDWEHLAAAGVERAEVCGRSGQLVPARARYSRRAGAVVLGLDHYCHWLGVPIGFGNRKLFILFIGYSTFFCAMGCAHSAHDLIWGEPARLALPSLLDALRGESSSAASDRAVNGGEWVAYILLRSMERAGSWLVRLLARAHAEEHLDYLSALIASVAINAAATVLLFFLTLQQLALSAFNRTTLEPNNPRYDRGLQANWRQIFGGRALFWALPLLGGGTEGGGPVGDGVHWADSTRWEHAQARAEARAQEATARARRAPTKLLLDPATQPPLPPGVAGRGRWALDRHHGRSGSSLTAASLSVLQRLRALARWWESRLCCGVMTIGSLRLVLRLRDLVRQRARGAMPTL